MALVIIAMAAIAAIGVGAWFATGYLKNKAVDDRARAQAEAVATVYEGANGNFELLAGALPSEYAAGIEQYTADIADELPEDFDVDIVRSWEDGVLTLDITFSAGDSSQSQVMSLEPAGDESTARVDVTEYDRDGSPREEYEATVKLQGDRWVVTGVGSSETLSELFEEYLDPQPPSEEEVCQSNQRTIMGSVQSYLADDPDNSIEDLVGPVEDGTPLVGDFIGEAFSCPADGSTYRIDRDGKAGCPSGAHADY